MYHDAAIVELPGRKPYVLVVLTHGIPDEKRAHKLVADISKAAFDEVVGPRVDHLSPRQGATRKE